MTMETLDFHIGTTMTKAISGLVLGTFLITLLALAGCGPSASSLDATCERHAEFTDIDGHNHVTHTCKDGLYLDGKFYG